MNSSEKIFKSIKELQGKSKRQGKLEKEILSFLNNIIENRNLRKNTKDDGFLRLIEKDINGIYSITVVAVRANYEIYMHDLEPIFQLDFYYNAKDEELHVFCDYLGHDKYFSVGNKEGLTNYLSKTLEKII